MLSDEFLTKGYEMSKRLGMPFVALLFVMNHESSLNPAAHNPAGANGLIQIMDFNLPKVGWNASPEEFRSLSAEDQLPYVERYLSWFKDKDLDTMGRIHQALFLPATLDDGSAPGLVLAAKDGTRWNGAEHSFYEGNKTAFDPQGKGYITVRDLEDADERAAKTRGATLQAALARLKEILPEALPVAKFALGAWFGITLLSAAGIGGYYLWKRRKGSK